MVPTAAPKTPSQRIIELTSELSTLEDRLASTKAKLDDSQRQLGRMHAFEGTSFGGVSMAQYWIDLMLWESVLNSNPQLKGLIEIGTWKGGFSWWMMAQCSAREISFHTYDVAEPEKAAPNFTRLDVFAYPEQIQKKIEEFGEPIAVFCDGGNKPRELKTFGAMLKDEGSLIAAHDWGAETLPSDVPDFLREEYGSYCDGLGSITRFFRIKSGSS